MAKASILCPIDGLPMSVASVTFLGDEKAKDDGKVIGKHLHLHFDQPLVCANGHTWVIDDLTINRKA